jgi:hypothetical protein
MASDQQKHEAKALVNEFRGRNPSGTWLNISAATFADSLTARVDDPDRIDTGLINLCGPGAFVRFLAEENPLAYVRIGIELFETGRTVLVGKGPLAGKVVIAGSDLRQHPVPNKVYSRGDGTTGTLDPADWIILASIRDSDNWFFDYQDQGDGVAGITLPHSMEKWLRAAGFTSFVNETNLFITKDLANVMQASRLRGQGYKVSLFINSNLLFATAPGEWAWDNIFHGEAQDDPSWAPDHWVALVSELKFIGNTDFPGALVEGKIHSWGQQREIAQDKVKHPLTVEKFLQNYYGFIACKY